MGINWWYVARDAFFGGLLTGILFYLAVKWYYRGGDK